MTSLFQILMLLLDVVWFILIAHIIMSWLINFQVQVLNLRQPLVAQLWYGLNRLLEPLYAPIRRLLPDMGGLDLAPLVVLLGIYSLRIILFNSGGVFVARFFAEKSCLRRGFIWNKDGELFNLVHQIFMWDEFAHKSSLIKLETSNAQGIRSVIFRLRL